MIARVWSGRVPIAKADRYHEYLLETGVEECRETPGNLGVTIWRRDEGDTTEFVFISHWESMDVIRGFAGDDVERAVYYPEDEAFLLELTPTVRHYTVPVDIRPERAS